MIAFLPITSMPLVSRILGSDSVASPSILFLFLFLCLWIVGFFLKGNAFIRKSEPLALFFLWSILVTLLSQFRNTPPFKDIGYIYPAVTGISTLAIGILFFISASSYPDNILVKKKALQIINWSGLMIISWSSLQALSWYTMTGYPDWMFNLQGIWSSRVLFRQRVTGFALEPSWLAHQLNMLYLPFWLASARNRYSSHEFRIFGFTFESVLLVFGIAVLGLTLSRVGYAAFLFMLFPTIIYFHKQIIKSVSKKGNDGERKVDLSSRMVSTALIISYIFLIAAGLYVYSRIDPRMAELFDFSFQESNSLLRYFNELKFGDRVVYWLTGWNIFNDFPFAGVGLGNAGFYFPDYLPPYGWALSEARRLIYRTGILLNIKSLWFRLLAETGIIGFGLFITWLLSLIPELIEKVKAKQKMINIIGTAGFYVLLAMIFEGFSIDSFAMPYWWISLGLAVSIHGREINIEIEPGKNK